jgi:hypothetical protein
MTFLEKIFTKTEASTRTISFFTSGEEPLSPEILSRIMMSSSIDADFTLYTYGLIGANKGIPLYVGGRYYNSSSNLNFVCYNTGLSANIPFYTEGLGDTPGAMPISGETFFFINRPTGDSINFYTYGGPQPSAENSMTLFLGAIERSFSNLNFIMPNVIDRANSNLTLITAGF